MEKRNVFLGVVHHPFKIHIETLPEKREIIFSAPLAKRKYVHADGKKDKGSEVKTRACNHQPPNFISFPAGRGTR